MIVVKILAACVAVYFCVIFFVSSINDLRNE